MCTQRMFNKTNHGGLSMMDILDLICNEVTLRDEDVHHSSYVKPLKIKDVIFNKPATIVFWNDGTKTVVKAQGKEKFDKEKGLAMAVVKKISGNTSRYYDVFKKFC